MKTHSNQFKETIKKQGRELDSKITYGSTVLGKEDLNAVSPSFETAILKSAMKQLEIDSNVQIPLGTILKYEFGVKVNNEFEYLDFGKYVVYQVEKQEDTESYNILCYDKMLFTMKPYKQLQNGTFPMSVRDYLTNLCLDCGLLFADTTKTFANYDKIIESDLYEGLDYTYRDIFDELAQVTASTICLNNNDAVEIRYINETNDTIDEEFFKDINVKFGEKYGKINSIVLSRSAESDNVYKQDETSVAENGLCELKIIDNQIMNGNDRSDYLPDILEKLNGLEYYINDFASTGICYYDICDRYNVTIGENTYSCVMFSNQINITQGLEENVSTEMPEQSETDYKKADKTDRKFNQAYIIVDKQKLEINSVVSRVGDNEGKIDALESEKETINKTLGTINETILKQTDKQFEMLFKETGVDKTLEELRGVVDSQNTTLDNIKAYIRYGTIEETDSPYFQSPYIELGKESSQAKIRILNERIQFLTNNEETAYITGNMLHINESTVIWKQIMGKAGVGKWITEIDSYGNQNTYWGGTE